MPQGTPIAAGAALALSTTISANQVQNTYDYVGPGKIKLYAKASAATVTCDCFVSGKQLVKRFPVVFTGTAGTMDTSANLIFDIGTMGGRVELTFVASTGTPTVDFLLTHEGIPFGAGISRLIGR